MRKRRRTIAVIATVLILGGGAFLAYRHIGGASADKPRYRTQPARRETIVQTVTASGTLSPLKTVQVGSQVSGRVLELHADFNSEVKKGNVIARIDPRLFESEVAVAKANLVSAKASLERTQALYADARKHHQRTRALAADKLVAQAEVDAAAAAATSALSQRTAAKSEIAQAEARLEQAQVNLAYTTIVAPIDGVVISRSVDVGQTVAASLSAPTLFTIAEDMRAMEVHTSIAESDVGVLSEGMSAELTVDAFPGVRFRGTVSQIRNAPTTVQNVVTYDAVVRVDNPELKLRPGMTANVTIVIQEHKDVLAVPSAALRFTPQTGNAPQGQAQGQRRGRGNRARQQRVVWVLDGNTPRSVPVELGISDGRLQEIVGGELTEGTLVIVGNTDAQPEQQRNQGGGQQQQRRGGRGLGL